MFIDWERYEMNAYNEMEYSMNNTQEHMQKRKRRTKLKQVSIIVLSTLLLSFLFSYVLLSKSMESLEGIWVRRPDDNIMANGMMIEIQKENGVYVGKIVAIDDESAMPLGTLKWNGFQKDALNVFAFYDMATSKDAEERTYSKGYALMSFDGSILTIYAPNASVGANQVWDKQK